MEKIQKLDKPTQQQASEAAKTILSALKVKVPTSGVVMQISREKVEVYENEKGSK